jgi:predicted RND superfamily exporter protein
MVKKLLQFSYSYPKSVLFFLVVLTMLAAPALQRLQFDISAQSLMVKSDPSWLQYEKSLQDFGSDSTIIIVLSDDELFKRDKLKKIRSALKQFKKLDFVKGTSSLFNVPNVQEVDGYVETRPFLLKLPETPEQIKTLLGQAQANPMVAGNLISADGKTMAINLQIDDTEHFAGRDREITNAIEQILRPLRQDLSEAFQMGAPYVRETISRQIEIDQRSILPAALVILIIVLGLSMGRLNCSIVPLSSATISIVLTLSFMAWMEIPVNVLTSIIPALLIIIGSTEDVHLMAEYHSGIRDGLTRDEAVQRLPVSQSMAIMLAFVTTFMGFISITVNDLELLREFGWLVSFGLTVNFLVTTLFVPAYLRLFGGTGIGLEFNRSIFQILADSIFLVVINWKKTTLFVMLLIAGYYAWGMQYLQVNNNTLAYFSEQSSVRQRAELIHQKLAGMQTFSVILDSPIEGTFKKVRYLEELHKSPEDPFLHYGLALALAKLRRFEEAVKEIQLVIQKFPENDDFLLDLAEIYFQSGYYEKALPILERYVKRHPYRSGSKYLLARCYQETKQNQKALALFKKLQDKMADHPDFHYHLGRLYAAMGKNGRAHYQFAEHFRLKGENKVALYHLRQAYLKLPKRDPLRAKVAKRLEAAKIKPQEG